MADDSFRSFRRSNPVPLGGAGVPVDDPLAELARLIGQNDPVVGAPRDDVPARDHYPQSGDADWAANARYADQDENDDRSYDRRGYGEDRSAAYYDEGREARLPDSDAPLPPALPDRAYAPSGSSQFEAPARRQNGRAVSRGYAAPSQSQYADEPELPPFLPRARDNRYDDDRYQYDDQEQAAPDDQYAMEGYDEDEAPRRRGGFVVIAAVLGLAVLGTAGAFAYRAMFGGSMLPSLPPIIKADDGPVKVVPSAANSAASESSQTAGNSGGDRLVPREETPMSVPQPASAVTPPTPHVVATIPIFPDQTPGPPSGMPANAPPPSVAPLAVPAAPPANVQPLVPLGPVAQQTSDGPPPTAGPEPSAGVPAPSIPGAKTIHTVPIRPDQIGSSDASAASAPIAPIAAQAAPSVAARPAAPQQQHTAKPALAPVAVGNAPLSIVPSQGGEPAPMPTRSASARPTVTAAATASVPAPGAGGAGYAVQVSSQRSEADAQAAFRALQAKYPSQLGGHQPIVRRADLGEKGIYYRALVGPFASMEQAAAMCSSLKAAGGTCIVQKD